MIITGLHILLTYQCTLECDHCFVWSSPWQTATLSFEELALILQAGRELETVNSVYFEGGEPFLYSNTLLRAVELASALGFSVGIVTNGYWATSVNDAVAVLRPIAGMVSDLSISKDSYHCPDFMLPRIENAQRAAEILGIPGGCITIAEPEVTGKKGRVGQLPAGVSAVMFRGRAVEKLASRAPRFPISEFDHCPHEQLDDPGRVHVDPLGYVQVCQGISIGNVFEKPLREIVMDYDAERHPIIGPLLAGGPKLLAEKYGLAVDDCYADACHLCYDARKRLRPAYPAELTPALVYGIL